ncbi:MAG: sugar ABC transporter substrate-binding protein [Hyphomicrobiales bacterium]|nr:sugar ABC transporter substrate-binding protein [Hyphomicrobiales bacterium]
MNTARKLASAAAIAIVSAAATSAAAEDRVYYYASMMLGHPYFLDGHLGLRYAAEKLGVEVRTIGVQGWDPAAHAEAVESAIAKNADGIITVMWEPGAIPAIKKAMALDIPVVVVESTVDDTGALAFIGLDNYQSGVTQAKELIRLAGKEGRYVASGNWGASNTDAKIQGFTDYITANSSWEEAGRVDDKASTADAIESSKAIFNTYKDIDAVMGFDASSGSGLCIAAEELGIDIKPLAIVVNDREAPVLECIADGLIDSSIVTKTALSYYMAIQLMELFNDENGALKGVPVTANNDVSGISVSPQNLFIGAEVINSENIQHFMHENIPQYE